jgi:hypothetical protein
MDKRPNNTSLEVADKPCRKIGGTLRSKVSRAMGEMHRIQMKKMRARSL